MLRVWNDANLIPLSHFFPMHYITQLHCSTRLMPNIILVVTMSFFMPPLVRSVWKKGRCFRLHMHVYNNSCLAPSGWEIGLLASPVGAGSHPKSQWFPWCNPVSVVTKAVIREMTWTGTRAGVVKYTHSLAQSGYGKALQHRFKNKSSPKIGSQRD